MTTSEIQGSPALDRGTLRQAFGCFPSGVIALCGLRADGTPHGMAVSAFGPVSLDPALVQVCIQNSSTTWPVLRAMPRLGVSVLGEGHSAIAQALASRSTDRFAGVGWERSADGAVFVRGSSLWLETTLESETPAGDHVICVLRIWSLTAYPEITPLVFHASRYRLLQPELPDVTATGAR